MKQKLLSKPEQLAAPVLARYGFIPCHDQFIPLTFYDPSGFEFRAKPDFYNPTLDIYIEVKDSHLNGKRTKATAENAFNRVEYWRYEKAPTYYQVQHQWNHSVTKQAIVQHTLTPARFMIVFTGKPDEKTLSRIERNGLHAYSLCRFSWFMLRWRLGQY